MYVIGRPIEGISINGREYVLDDNDKVMKFETVLSAKMFLIDNCITESMIRNEGMEILDENICNLGEDE